MFELFRRSAAILFAGVAGLAGAASAQPVPSGDPPARVGRLAFVEGTVSFHDRDQSDWAPATINRPLTSGDAVWTEPNAHSEISIAGTRVRLDAATQLDMVAIDDQRTRLQLDQGRVDVKTFNFDAHQPYELVTPRGVATLEQQGDYYVEAGSTDDPTRLGVRQGAAQFQAPDGRVLAVRANEVVEITGDGSSMELHTIQAPPPPMPPYWAQRDRVVVYDQPPQYLSAGVTGYEDLDYYGTWQNDSEYGQVWYVRDAPSGWAPYTTGRWVSDAVYGWTWVDEQPWGFAPYHYGRWAHRGERWFWVPPQRDVQPVYAPALVAFVGGTELGIALGQQSRAPVGWFPLGPREVYVPPYSTDRDYYRRVNVGARVQAQVMEDHWQRAQRHEAIAEQNWMNRRFVTVVPAQDFARSQPVERVALRVAPEKLATVPVAAVAVPPSPTVSVRAVQAPTTSTAPGANQSPPRPGEPPRPTVQGKAGANTSVQAKPAMLQAIKPEPQAQKAPGPKIAARTGVTTGPTTGAAAGATANTATKPALPKLEPRNASAPPLPQIQGERKPATTQPGTQHATSPPNQPSAPAKPGEPPKPGQAQPGQQQPGQANLPPVRDHNGQPPKPGEPSHAQPPRQGQAEPPNPATQPPHQATPATPAQPAIPPRPQQAQQPTLPPHQATPATPAQPATAAQPPHSQQAQQPAPPAVQHQAAPPPVQHQPAPPPAQAHAPAPAPQPQTQAHAPAPPPQMAHPAPAPQPPQQAHAPAPPPPQAAHPAPQPQAQPQQHPQQAQQPAPKKEEQR